MKKEEEEEEGLLSFSFLEVHVPNNSKKYIQVCLKNNLPKPNDEPKESMELHGAMQHINHYQQIELCRSSEKLLISDATSIGETKEKILRQRKKY